MTEIPFPKKNKALITRVTELSPETGTVLDTIAARVDSGIDVVNTRHVSSITGMSYREVVRRASYLRVLGVLESRGITKEPPYYLAGLTYVLTTMYQKFRLNETIIFNPEKTTE